MWMCFVKLITNDKFWSAFSSIDPTELYTKNDESKIANEKIRTSWFESSSKAPKPSESMTKTLMFSPSAVNPGNGFFHIHNPYNYENLLLYKDLLLVQLQTQIVCLKSFS